VMACVLNGVCLLVISGLGKTTGRASIEIPRLLLFGSLAACTLGASISLIRSGNPNCQVAGLCGLVLPSLILWQIVLEGIHYW
jgi:hypothetical protein